MDGSLFFTGLIQVHSIVFFIIIMGKQEAFFSMFLIKLVGVTSIRGSVGGGGGITYVGQKYNEGFINFKTFLFIGMSINEGA